MKKLLIFICCTVLLSCGHRNRAKNASLTENIVVAETANATNTIDNS